METLLLALGQLVFVAVVYLVAYKSGYKAAQDKAASAVKEFAGPVNELLDKLDQRVDQSIVTEHENRNT